MNNVKHEILNTATNFAHLIKDNETKTLSELSEIIIKVYSIDNPKIKILYDLLNESEGTMIKNRHGKIFLKYKKLN